jgi:hypothetical protein
MRQFVFVLLLLPFALIAQPLSYFLSSKNQYNPAIPTPRQILGHEVGEWHVTHDKLVSYMQALEAASDRVIIEEYARTYESRLLMNVIITSPKNLARLAEIKASRQQIKSGKIPDGPLVIYQGYSVHGNEPSGSNAVMLYAYHLAAGTDPTLGKMLENVVIILDPCLNPDGLQRYASWVNAHKSTQPNPDPNDREHNEPWPSSRGNHYWFDLNRDWLTVQHPESKGRIRQYQDWLPTVLTDHHEMGTNNTFFFQPGVASRVNPLTPLLNQTLTAEIGKYHALALDSIGSLYYSKEGYDDYFIGKGSSYPDITGSIGILFEQASARGHAQENPYGVLRFPFAIRNQLVTSFSTLRASMAMSDKLKKYQAEFYRNPNLPAKSYLFGNEHDPHRLQAMLDILLAHGVDVHHVSRDVRGLRKGSAFIVPAGQPEVRLIEAMFEQRQGFTDSLFYDISSWSLPQAFDLRCIVLTGKEIDASLIGEKVTGSILKTGQLHGKGSPQAYLLKPTCYNVFKSLNRLLSKGILVEVIHRPHGTNSEIFPQGSLVVPLGVQPEKSRLIEQAILEIRELDGLDVYALSTGLSTSGVDLGSPSKSRLELPRVALLVDEGVTSTEAGEVWHLLDQRVGMAVTLLPSARVNTSDLSRYNRIVMPSGSYSTISTTGKDNLKRWVQNGGVLIGWKTGARWLAANELSKAEFEKDDEKLPGNGTYADYSLATGTRNTSGAILHATLDRSHPLAYGFTTEYLALFRNHNLSLKKSENPYSQPLRYMDNPVLSGYVHPAVLSKIKSSPAAQVTTLGRGRVIILADNPNFRGFWYGTNRLFLNALWFGGTIDAGTGR